MLRHTFPGFEVDVFDTFDLMRRHGPALVVNAAAALLEQGPLSLSGRRRFQSAFFSSSFLFHKVGAWVAQALSRERYAFSFQTQSMGCDGSLSGLPHFIYTDDTRLAPRLFDPSVNVVWSDKRLGLERQVYEHAAATFTMGSHIRRSIIEQYGANADRIHSVGAGSNVEPQGSTGPRPYGAKNILFVGIEWERKGGRELTAAFERVLRVHPDARLTVVGCSPALNLPNCHIVGRVPRAEVARHYQEASIFCLPTKAEPFGVVFVEAQMYRLPVVATNTHSIPDIVEHGRSGYLTPVGDVDALTDSLMTLLNDSAIAREFGERGYASAAERFTWRAVGEKMKSVILPTVPLSGN